MSKAPKDQEKGEQVLRRLSKTPAAYKMESRKANQAETEREEVRQTSGVPPMRTPSSAALYKVVLIKPADDPSFTPDQDLSEFIFWYDPNLSGCFLRPVYPQPSPITIGKVIAALVEQAEPPTTDMHGLT